METDKTTLTDLSIFDAAEDFSVFAKFDLTRTTGGRDVLKYLYTHSLKTIEEIRDTQAILKLFIDNQQEWPLSISNGSIMMIYKFYETAVDQIPSTPSGTSAFYYKLFHGPDFGLVKYSASHAFDFLKGMHSIIKLFEKQHVPAPLAKILAKAEKNMAKPNLQIVIKREKFADLSTGEMLAFAAFIRYHYKQLFYELLHLYFQMDAWYGMAMAVKEFKLVFPEFIESSEPVLKAKGLYHSLITEPVPYDVELNNEKNFIFLTGANMAGKSTFIKAVGGAVFLAHIGMGVPAAELKISLFDGLLSNINVIDNVVKGESYFFNEVRRIKDTVLKVMDKRKWLILIDELFKGTNIQDAMKCSTVVIQGLIKVKHSLFILSTHLYEISDDLKPYQNIDFKYFETGINGDDLKFSYQLKEGVSNDRFGYLILKNEKVTDLLDDI